MAQRTADDMLAEARRLKRQARSVSDAAVRRRIQRAATALQRRAAERIETSNRRSVDRRRANRRSGGGASKIIQPGDMR